MFSFLFLLLAQATPDAGTVHLVAADPFGRSVPEAQWTLEGDVLLATGDTHVQMAPGHYRMAVTAPGYFGHTVAFDVISGKDVEVQAQLDASLVTLTDKAIVIHDKIYFETAKAVIKTESHELLRQVARVMLEHPEIQKVSVEGHADARGADAYNLKLSDQRAAAVRAFLIAQGVSALRLDSQGYGESKPIVDESTEQAWEKNRRVEFMISKRADLER
ncbi:MAG: outer membrane protein OmpA-like peptidoglycan-associated protein [Cognaticolwellia sp.]|jgi:outer membrane protein OmpA-like peptidoglycan-associated protein